MVITDAQQHVESALARAVDFLAARYGKFDPNQPRDDDGRWTDGGAVGTEPIISEEDRENLVDAIISEIGFDPSAASYQGSGYEFEVGGTKCTAIGDYNPETGEIRIYSGAFRSDELLRSVVAHEHQHHVYTIVEKKYHDELQDIMRRGMAGEDIIKPSGELREQYKEQYKIYAILQPFHDERSKELSKKDGVSTYSRMYWTDEGMKKYGWTRAVNETLAEVSSAATEKRLRSVAMVWRDYWRAQRRAYELSR